MEKRAGIYELSMPQRELMAREFDSLTPENQAKWDFIHPEPEVYDFEKFDDIVDFAAHHRQSVRGHTLMWGWQLPAWVEEGNYSQGQLRDILREHIYTVVGRYRGRIRQWDVCNEVLDEDGSLHTDNYWIAQLGEDIIGDCFRWAHEADPGATLFFNDYNAESINAKSEAYLDLIARLLKQGVAVGGFAVQCHLLLDSMFPEDLGDCLERFGALGIETAVTELDVRGRTAGGPMSEELRQEQASWFARVARTAIKAQSCTSLTLWGVTDEQSWVPSQFPGYGDATVFEDDLSPKPAYAALRDSLGPGC